jgi:hypothetical protein
MSPLQFLQTTGAAPAAEEEYLRFQHKFVNAFAAGTVFINPE